MIQNEREGKGFLCFNIYCASTSIKFNYTNKIKRTISNPNEGSCKKTKFYHNENISDLFKMRNPYLAIELPEIYLAKKIVHLYPTKRIISIHSEYEKSKSMLSFKSFIETYFSKEISINTETTLYLPKIFLHEAKKLSIKNNVIMRDNKEVNTESNIFILDENSQFFVTNKKKEGKHGRIHHSSLSNGNPVLAAGTIKVEYCFFENKKFVNCKLTNKSGHYRPNIKCLNSVLEWFRSSGFKFVIKSDQTKEAVGYENGIREIILETV